MKRPPGLWILLSAGVLWLCLQDVYGIRATALIFGKSTTSTTTEAASSNGSSEDPEASGSNTEVPDAIAANVSTSPTLTGNPQIDYIYDPNLPQELNGYNLSSYPFYERVPDPEEIDFKCDGLHDGFYASIPHKCQVYHHCLFGTRFDFLCANYTAFDQKTFICQFVSVVDCQNSKKFWHRNDALYKSESTTTAAPLNLKAAIYTTAPPPGADPITPLSVAPRRRPLRPRPPVDYYYPEDDDYDADYYEDRQYYRPRLRQRPLYRPHRRPMYIDQDDEEYEDKRYSKGRRRPYKKRRPIIVDEEELEDEEQIASKPKHSQKPEDRRPKRPVDSVEDEEEEEEEEIRPRPSKRPSDRKSTRKGSRRPPPEPEYDDSEETEVPAERPSRKKQNKEPEASKDSRPIITSSTGTIYDRPRVAPRINLPVPKNVADRFSFKKVGSPATKTTTPVPPSASAEEEYEDEVIDQVEEEKPKPKHHHEEVAASRPKPEKLPGGLRSRYRPSSSLRRKPSPSVVDEEAEEEEVQQKPTSTTTTTTSTTTTTTTETPTRKKEPIMRIIKRPFLPSRGGNPYSPRGLQPVGLKAVDKIESQESRYEEPPASELEEKPFKASPVLYKIREPSDEIINLEPTRQQNHVTRERVRRPETEEYDVTLNDALNPTLPNLPVRAFPTGFAADYSQPVYSRPRYVLAESTNQNYALLGKGGTPINHQYQPHGIINSGGGGFRQQPAQTQALYSRY